MRYDRGRKSRTRERILAVAGEQFKERGVAASGVSAFMAAAGLTNGAFYTHFTSKDSLVEAVIVQQMDAEAVRFASGGGDAAVRTQIRGYLSREHLEDRAGGCATAAMAADIARTSREVRRSYTVALLRSIEGLASRFPDATTEGASVKALGVFAILVGALQTARAVDDARLADAILEEGRRHAFRALHLQEDY